MNGNIASMVRPRVISPEAGETLLLEDVIASHFAAGDQGFIAIQGGPVSGKSTAIRYLDHVFRDSAGLELYDEHILASDLSCCSGQLKVATTKAKYTHPIAMYSLARWDRDEWIEYLLANHKDRCASVMRRLAAELDHTCLEGNPFLWRLVLDEMANDESAENSRQTLRRIVDRVFQSPDLNLIRKFALLVVGRYLDQIDPHVPLLAQCEVSPLEGRLLCLEPVRRMLAIEGLLAELKKGIASDVLDQLWPVLLIRHAGVRVRTDPELQNTLRRILASPMMAAHPVAASLLHVAEIGWKPDLDTKELRRGRGANFRHGFFADADWAGKDLQLANLMRADLSRSNLTNCNLNESLLNDANFRQANLHGALLSMVSAKKTIFANADLTFVRASGMNCEAADMQGANLEGGLFDNVNFGQANLAKARLVRTNLTMVSLRECNIEGADFSQANLENANLMDLDLRTACFDHAKFEGANLARCNLEGMELPGADFRGASLLRAHLTGSMMSHAQFVGADLRETGMADVEWEFVDLRNADLRNVQFHMGSTRSGLVGSPYPSHGTRTGFYTDDLSDQDFKAPEEIRHANLRGADLRGANITAVDFYLVDLRDAIYDEEQEQHLRRCGAILEHRVRCGASVRGVTRTIFQPPSLARLSRKLDHFSSSSSSSTFAGTPRTTTSGNCAPKTSSEGLMV